MRQSVVYLVCRKKAAGCYLVPRAMLADFRARLSADVPGARPFMIKTEKKKTTPGNGTHAQDYYVVLPCPYWRKAQVVAERKVARELDTTLNVQCQLKVRRCSSAALSVVHIFIVLLAGLCNRICEIGGLLRRRDQGNSQLHTQRQGAPNRAHCAHGP
jgi:hypothetical protein